jgi:hypothetical protein
MSQTSPEAPPRSDYQPILDSALQAYKTKTGKDLLSDPLFRRLESCATPDDVITILRQQIPRFNQSASGSSDDRFTKWLGPTVNVINALSSTIGDSVALVSLML